ncbi:tetratricopeptide repeat protein [Streptomyces sp. JNUCC 64]
MTDHVENRLQGPVFGGVNVQARDINSLVVPDRPDPALAGLPRKSAGFAGRHAELEQLLDALAPKARGETAATVVVAGLAGMGKTELVLQAAHQALEREGWFPGGVLFISLHGDDTKHEVSPKRALGTLLRALAVPPDHLPPGIEERAHLFRSKLAAMSDAGRRVLVVLDDVPATRKIRHLLPGDGKTATLISSRHSLSELDALVLTLRELPVGDGRALLDGAVRASRPEDTRVAVEADEADRLVSLCGGLPLALRILASFLVDAPARPLSDLRRDLADTHSRLSVLSREERAVTAAFQVSHRRLSEEQARLFLRMGLQPGPDFSTEAAALLYGGTFKETERLLLALARRHLVEPLDPYGRWGQHGLVRLYCWEELLRSDDEWGENLVRLLLHFHAKTTSACQVLFGPVTAPSTTEPPFTDRAAALEWLEAERPTLVAATLWAHESGDDPMCAALAVPVARFLTEMRYLEDAQLVLVAGVLSNRALKEEAREAALLSSLGVVLQNMRKLRKSVRVHAKAVKICRKLKRPRALGGALNNLGLALHERRRFEEALAAHTKAERLLRRAGDHRGMAGALSNASETLIELDRLEEAARALRKAAKVFRRQGDTRGYSQALGSLAKMTRNVGNAEHAVKMHRRALSADGGLLIPHERAIELSNFAGTLIAVGDPEGALTAQREALDIFRRLGDRCGEGMTLGNMATAQRLRGAWEQAVRLHTLAMEALLEGKDDHALSVELANLAQTLIQGGRHAEALETLEHAAALCQQAKDTEGAAQLLDLADQVRRRFGAVSRRPRSGA